MGSHLTSNISDEVIRDISTLSLGNAGVAIRILEEIIRFSLNLEDIRLTFGIDPGILSNFPPSKSPILREILVREIQNRFLPQDKREFFVAFELYWNCILSIYLLIHTNF